MFVGVTTGTLAILCAQPTDVVKVRMQAAGGKGQYKVRIFLMSNAMGFYILFLRFSTIFSTRGL